MALPKSFYRSLGALTLAGLVAGCGSQSEQAVVPVEEVAETMTVLDALNQLQGDEMAPATEAVPEVPRTPMPENMLGTWLGYIPAGFGSSSVELYVVDEGVYFSLGGRCRGATTADHVDDTGEYEILVSVCDYRPTFKVVWVMPETMKLSLDLNNGKDPYEVELKRTGSGTIVPSTHPEAAFDIVSLPFTNAAAFKSALEAHTGATVYSSANFNGPGQIINWQTLRSSPNPMGRGLENGESIGAATLGENRNGPAEADPIVAMWRLLRPEAEERPLYSEVVDGLLAKYGEPSFRDNAGKMKWFYSNSGARLTGEPAKNCDVSGDATGVFLGYYDYTHDYLNIAGLMRGNAGCGISISVEVGHDSQDRLDRMTVFVQDQQLARTQAALRAFGIARGQIRDALEKYEAAKANSIAL